jgi:hypothetical protein
VKLLCLKKFRLTICFALFLSQLAFAWDSTGHRIIAQIAYDNLTLTAQDKIDQLTKVLDPKYPGWSRFFFCF